MKWLLRIIFAAALIIGTQVADAQEVQNTTNQDSLEKIYYFYSTGCGHCAKVDEYLTNEGFYDKYPIVKVNVDDKDNALFFLNICEKELGSKNACGVPFIWLIDSGYLLGDTFIIQDFEKAATSFLAKERTTEELIAIRDEIDKMQGIEVPKNADDPNNSDDNDNNYDQKLDITIVPVVTGALVDSINPCAFAVLILLLTTILAVGDKKKALLSGLFFAASIFLSYLAMGLGLYKALSLGAAFSTKLMSFFGVLAIILGFLNIKDYFNYGGGGFVMEVPFGWRPKMKSLLARVTTPVGAFFIGFVISLFLLPCTSGPYIVVLGMLSQKHLFAKALSYLVLYNLIFILPMLLITFGVYKGMDIKKAEKQRQKQIKTLHLIAGLLLIGMGIWILFL